MDQATLNKLSDLINTYSPEELLRQEIDNYAHEQARLADDASEKIPGYLYGVLQGSQFLGSGPCSQIPQHLSGLYDLITASFRTDSSGFSQGALAGLTTAARRLNMDVAGTDSNNSYVIGAMIGNIIAQITDSSMLDNDRIELLKQENLTGVVEIEPFWMGFVKTYLEKSANAVHKQSIEMLLGLPKKDLISLFSAKHTGGFESDMFEKSAAGYFGGFLTHYSSMAPFVLLEADDVRARIILSKNYHMRELCVSYHKTAALTIEQAMNRYVHSDIFAPETMLEYRGFEGRRAVIASEEPIAPEELPCFEDGYFSGADRASLVSRMFREHEIEFKPVGKNTEINFFWRYNMPHKLDLAKIYDVV